MFITRDKLQQCDNEIRSALEKRYSELLVLLSLPTARGKLLPNGKSDNVCPGEGLQYTEQSGNVQIITVLHHNNVRMTLHSCAAIPDSS